MRKRSILAALALVTIGLVFGVVLVSAVGNSFGVQGGFAKGTGANITLGGPVPKINGAGDVKSINSLFSSVSKAVLPSVVNIRVVERAERGMGGQRGGGDNPHNFFFRFFGPNGPQGGGNGDDEEQDMGQDRETAGAGSGVIISADGYIITNNHVVENATSVKVFTYDRHQYEATVVGTDPSTDLAVV